MREKKKPWTGEKVRHNENEQETAGEETNGKYQNGDLQKHRFGGGI